MSLKKFDLSIVRVGDFLGYRSRSADDKVGGILSWFQVSKRKQSERNVHIARVSKIVDGVIFKIEHHLSTDIVEKPVNPEDWEFITIYRFKFSDLDNKILSERARALIGTPEADYDEGSFFSMWIRSTVGKIMNWKKFRKDKPLFNDSKKDVCSTLWPHLANDYLGVEMFRNICFESVQPEDYDGNKQMVKRKLRLLEN